MSCNNMEKTKDGFSHSSGWKHESGNFISVRLFEVACHAEKHKHCILFKFLFIPLTSFIFGLVH